MSTVEEYMWRCIGLARKGEGYVAPNPMVGAVLVYDNRIIGEGWHHAYGQPHAEVNCILDAKEKGNGEYISHACLYVSLEPCAHFGKTPPCADRIIRETIPRVVVGVRDPFEKVDGKGIEKLLQNGIEVVTGVLQQECTKLNRRFFTFHQKKRPYIILKWAETKDGIIGDRKNRLRISNEFSDRLVHQWRSKEASILVGTNTAMTDDPLLTNRLWSGPSPLRVLLDMDLKIPATARVFNDINPIMILNGKQDGGSGDVKYVRLEAGKSIPGQICEKLYREGIQSILLEGGGKLLQSFIDAGLWDECRIIKATRDIGIPEEPVYAPELTGSHLINDHFVGDNLVECYSRATR